MFTNDTDKQCFNIVLLDIIHFYLRVDSLQALTN
jgi:hypothetical protein